MPSMAMYLTVSANMFVFCKTLTARVMEEEV